MIIINNNINININTNINTNINVNINVWLIHISNKYLISILYN